MDPQCIEPAKEESEMEIPVLQVDESLIEEKLKKLLPSLVAKVKTEIEEEQSERSRFIESSQPEIIEEPIKIQKEEPILKEMKK